MTHAVILAIGRKSRDEKLQFSLNGTEVRVMEAEGAKKTWRMFLGDGVDACDAEGKEEETANISASNKQSDNCFLRAHSGLTLEP